MIAIAQDLVLHIREISGNVLHVWAVARIRLKEFIPQQDSVLVCQIVEVWARALPDPVADHIQIRKSVHVELGIKAVVRDPFHGFIQTPIAATHHHLDAVDGDGEIVGVWNRVFDLANA